MRMITLIGFLIIICVVSVSCDGHGRIVYIVNSSVPIDRMHGNSIVLYVSSDEDVVQTIEAIAHDFGLQKSERTWEWQAGQFYLLLDQPAPNIWRLRLLDWPSFIRSDLSRGVEKRLLTAFAP